ncbi:MerR family transcriptional regulator [Nonomuraea sp. CA-143628]|uniref:MerR family transcriptional regulator n=1 Tax=Nonomuraea sp. CA-143628 TaxID=3239997 RepID=UPI003D91ACFD
MDPDDLTRFGELVQVTRERGELHPAGHDPSTPRDPRLKGCRPRVYRLCGTDIELFSMGQLATVLNREAGTIRKWERDGVLPAPQFRAPSHDPRGTRRLYTRSQVLAIHDLAKEEGILQPHARSIKDTRFVERVLIMFRECAVNTQKDVERHNSSCPARDPKCLLSGVAGNVF